MEEMKNENQNLQHERRSNISGNWNTMKKCGSCFSFFEGKCISCHQKNCNKDSSKNITPLPIMFIQPIANVKIMDEFKMKILAKFWCNRIQGICQTDPTIVTVGLRLYGKMKLDKATEKRKSVRTDTRCLAHLYNLFKELPDINSKNNNAMDTINRVNYYHLSDAITQYTTREGGKIKPGLKSLYSHISSNLQL